MVDELLTLSDCHIFHPSYMTAPVNVRVKLLQYVLDFPAISKVLHQPGAGAAVACPWCGIAGCFVHSLKKTVYLQSRRYLEDGDPLRNSPDFTNVEQRGWPPVLAIKAEAATRELYDKLLNKNQKKTFEKVNVVKGRKFYPI